MIKFIGLLLLICTTVDQSLAQVNRKWFLETAIRFTGDAEMVFIGPSVGVGVGVNLGKRLSVSTSYTFFKSSLSNPDETFRTHTIDLISNFHFQNVFNPAKGLYVGVGPALQFRKQELEELMVERPTYWTAVFNVGYRFPVTLNKKPRSLSVDLKATGPYSEKHPQGEYVEALTQFMVGVRLRY